MRFRLAALGAFCVWSCAPTPPPPPQKLQLHGDLVIERERVFENQDVTLINGNVFVRGTGRLVFRRSTLTMKSTDLDPRLEADGESSVMLEDSEVIIPRWNIADRSALTATQSSVGRVQLSRFARFEAQDARVYELSVDERAAARVKGSLIVRLSLNFRSSSADFAGLTPAKPLDLRYAPDRGYSVQLEQCRVHEFQFHMREKSSVGLSDCSGVGVTFHVEGGFSGFSGLKPGFVADDAAVDRGMANSVRLRRVTVSDWSFRAGGDAVVSVSNATVGQVSAERRSRVVLLGCVAARDVRAVEDAVLELEQSTARAMIVAGGNARLVLRSSRLEEEALIHLRDTAVCELWKMARPERLVRDPSTRVLLEGAEVKD